MPSAPNVTDLGGEAVRHSVDVRALGPKLESISQLMFFEGETNSVLVDVWGTSVPEVCEVLDVVVAAVLEVVDAAVVVVVADVVVVVVDEDDEAGPLEQAASATAQAGRIIRRTDRLRSAIGIAHAFRARVPVRSGSLDDQARHPRTGTGRGLPCERHPRGRQNRGSVMTMIPSQFAGLAGGIVAFVAIFIALFSLVLLVPIILIVANRAEPDQRGQRSHSVYLFGMSFVALQLTFAGSVLIVTSIFSVISPHVAPLTNSIARSVVIGGLLVVLFGAVLLLHLGRGIEVARGDGGVTGPNLRCMQSYAGVVSFIYLLQLIVALAVSIYLVFALIAPGVFGSLGSSRSGTLALLLDLVYVMLASGYILLAHSSLGPTAVPTRRPPTEVPAA